jgi:diadenosine tetraphosphate (Ap4A) HIT family hydrolase
MHRRALHKREDHDRQRDEAVGDPPGGQGAPERRSWAARGGSLAVSAAPRKARQSAAVRRQNTIPTTSTHPECGTCRANRGELAVPGGVVYDDGLWRAEHAIEPIPMVGWLVLKPLRHVETFADLTVEEALGFGTITHRLARALTAELGATKVYLSLYAEAEHFAHVHVHLIPRRADLPPERRGPRVFEYLREAIAHGNQGDVAEAARVAAAIRARLGEPTPDGGAR